MLGGGFGGASAALTLRELLPAGHTVTLVDRATEAHLCSVNPLTAVGARPVAGVTRSIASLASAGIEVVTAEITAIDTAARVVTTDRATHRFDHLVVALGAGYDWEAVPGSAQAETFYHHDGARRLRARLAGFEAGTVTVAVAGSPVKCPPAAIEGILLIEDWARRRGIRSEVDLHLAIPEPAPLAVAGAKASRRVIELLGGRGVTLHAGATLTEVGGSGTVATFEDGRTLAGDVVVVVPRHRMPAVVEASGLAAGHRWVPVDPATLETGHSGIFAIGDVNLVPTRQAVLPKAGVFASGEGRHVAALIASRVLDGEAPAPYDGTGSCFLTVSPEASATVGGTFLGPTPAVGLGEATTEGMADKLRWEDDWRAFRI